MKDNQRNNNRFEELAALHAVKVLQAENQDGFNEDELQISEMGQLIRQTSSLDLPDPNPDLRSQVLKQIESEFGTESVTSTEKNVSLPPGLSKQTVLSSDSVLKKRSSSSRARMFWSAAASLALAAGGWWLYNVDSAQPYQMTDGTLLRYQLSSGIMKQDEETVSRESPEVKRGIPKVNVQDGLRVQSPNVTLEQPPHAVFFAEKQKSLWHSDSSTRGPVSVDKSLKATSLQKDSVRFGEQVQFTVAGGGFGVKTPKRKISKPGAGIGGGGAGILHNYDMSFNADLGKNEPANRSAEFLSGGEIPTVTMYEGQHKSYSNAESYAHIVENSFNNTTGSEAVSTFSIDVDTASYANMRRFINNGQLPPPNSVRLEELINYFDYDYPQPEGDDPFSVNMELADCPWNKSHKLLRVGLKGKEVQVDKRPATNLVFLIDVSGSMNNADKLPLLKTGFQMMVNQLGENDTVAIVTYAGNAGVALEPTNGSEKRKINDAIESLKPGGSTHGSAGIKLAYEFAQKNFIHNGVNKVILATDGDLNVGITENGGLVKLIKEKAAENVFLTVLGFGSGNIKDDKMEALADNGNGMYAYIDGIREAHKVLVEEMSSSLVTIAKDVKIQIEFNPAEVTSYRLIGYENRILAARDFNDDQIDAGEIGAGHTVTAIYELVTTDKSSDSTSSASMGLKYQLDGPDVLKTVPVNVETKVKLSAAAKSGELLTLALRYKQPEESVSKEKEIEYTIKNDQKSFSTASSDFRFAASVASFGMLLRNSKHQGETSTVSILDWAAGAIGDDQSGYRAEFLEIVRKAKSIYAQ